MISKIKITVIISFIILLTNGCGQNKSDVNRPAPIELPEEKLELQFIRFEEELFATKIPVDATKIAYFRKKYGDFFELWFTRLAGILPPGEEKPSDAEIAFNLSQYLGDKYIREVYNDCEKQYKDISDIREELTTVMQRYHISFPGKPIPVILTYLSPFTSNVMAMDSVMGIGLHFYLGGDYKYYPSLQLPQYMVRKMSREYIINDLIRGWLDSEYMDDSVQKNCLSQMIYQGKVLYAMDVLSPETDDTIKTGYKAKQLEWAIHHEEQVWGFFIEQQLLYNGNPKIYIKYIQDGNSTNGFPKDAPARLGAFIGWHIVRAYMKKHESINLKTLFEMKDAQKILTESGYKPLKSAS